MAHSILVTVRDALEHLSEKVDGSEFSEHPLLSDHSAEALLASVFENQIEFFALSCDFDQFDDSIMGKIPEMPNLSFDAGKPIPIKCFYFFVGFDGIVLMVFLANCQGDHRKGSFTNVRHNLIRLQGIWIRAQFIEIPSLLSLTSCWSNLFLGRHHIIGPSRR